MCFVLQQILLKQTITIWYIYTEESDVNLKDEIKDNKVDKNHIKEVNIDSEEYPGIKGET